MKLLLCTLLFLASNSLVALTPAEFRSKTPEDKIRALGDELKNSSGATSTVLQTFASALGDPAVEVQRAAARGSIYLMNGLQQAARDKTLPAFVERDYAPFQQALRRLAESNDRIARTSALTSLTFSEKPNAKLAVFLMTALGREADAADQGKLLESMAMAGYPSEELSRAALRLLEPNAGFDANFHAGEALSYLQPEFALDRLIELAYSDSPAARHALLPLEHYGQKAARVIPALETLVNDAKVQQETRNLARVILDALKSGKQPEDEPRRMIRALSVLPETTAGLPPNTPVPSTLTPSTPAPGTPRPMTDVRDDPALSASVEKRVPRSPPGEPSSVAPRQERRTWIYGGGIAMLLFVAAWLLFRRK